MKVYNENFFDFFANGEGVARSLYSNYSKLVQIHDLVHDGVVPSPLQKLPDPSMNIVEPLIEYRVYPKRSLDPLTITIIIGVVIVLAMIVYYLWDKWKDKKKDEQKQVMS